MIEKQIFMKFSSPFVIKLYYSFQTAEKLYFIFDFVNGGELYGYCCKKKYSQINNMSALF